MDEQQLIDKAKQGDVNAYNTLVLHYQEAIYNYAYYVCSDPDMAADATQNAFISAYKKLHQFRGGSFKAWLMRIVRNKCLDMLRKRQRHPNPSLDEMTEEFESMPILADDSAGPESQHEQSELMVAVENCLQALPEEQRTTVVLRDVEGFDYEEIGRILAVSLGTVKSRINRARRRLQACLQDSAELLPARYRL
jgi:RNA polymerase sigma-70 factor (ECF subfamily)